MPTASSTKTDLVFVDPVGTGFSRAVGKAKDKDFWGIDQDVKSLAQLIATYISRNGRWNSPKFLIGESYGTFRSAALGNYLQQHNGMYFNGIDLISSVLDLGTISFSRPATNMPYIFLSSQLTPHRFLSQKCSRTNPPTSTPSSPKPASLPPANTLQP